MAWSRGGRGGLRAPGFPEGIGNRRFWKVGFDGQPTTFTNFFLDHYEVKRYCFAIFEVDQNSWLERLVGLVGCVPKPTLRDLGGGGRRRGTRGEKAAG